jgi:hypothetical protein
VFVGGNGVGVGGTDVAVAVGGTGVAVGGTGVAVGGTGVKVAVAGATVSVAWATAVGAGVEPHPVVAMPSKIRPAARTSLLTRRGIVLILFLPCKTDTQAR